MNAFRQQLKTVLFRTSFGEDADTSDGHQVATDPHYYMSRIRQKV